MIEAELNVVLLLINSYLKTIVKWHLSEIKKSS